MDQKSTWKIREWTISSAFGPYDPLYIYNKYNDIIQFWSLTMGDRLNNWTISKRCQNPLNTKGTTNMVDSNDRMD